MQTAEPSRYGSIYDVLQLLCNPRYSGIRHRGYLL